MENVFAKPVSPSLTLYLSITVIFLSAFLPQTSSQLPERRIDPEIQAKIDDFVQNTYLPAAQVEGMGLTIVQDDGEIVYTAGYGLSNREKGIPNTNTTQFLLGSTTKSLTAMLAVKVLHETFPDLGEAVLDTPIRKLMPEVNFTLRDRFRSEQATFRDLMGHRLCIYDMPLMADPFNSTEEMVYRTRYNPDVCGMRSDNVYTNQMYIVVAHLIGILGGKPYEEQMEDLWKEIGMLDTEWIQKTDNFTDMPYRTMPYYVKDNEVYPFNPELIKRMKFFNAAGGIFVTPNGMIRYMRFHLNFGNIDGKQIIPKEVMEWLTKPSNIVPAYGYKSSDEDKVYSQFAYGLALIVSTYDGWKYVQHRGHYPPYHNHMSLFPGKNLGVYSGTHMGFNRVPEVILHGFIFDTLKGHPNAKERALRRIQQALKEEDAKAKKVEDDFQGLYGKMKGKAIKLQQDEKILLGSYGSGYGGDLVLSEKFNEETNQTQFFIDYGVWYKGWLEVMDGETAMFRVNWATDIIQENYALGQPDRQHYVAFIGDDTLNLFGTIGPVAEFKLGVNLDVLPVVPWDPTTCGIEGGPKLI